MRHTSLFPAIAAFTCACLLWVHPARSNNIQVTNPTLTGNTGTSALVQFDLSWENSWRGGGVSNWDAAWVFVKYRPNGGGWQHVLLSNTGHTAPAGSIMDMGLLIPGGGTPYDPTANPVVGTFIRRSIDGSGTFALTGVQLRWNYGTQGLAYNDIAQVQVFAIEMIAVLQGAFAIGSGGTESLAFTLTTINTGNTTVAPAGTGSLGGQAGGYPTGQAAPNILWPNGFNAFNCMKYEVSQQGCVDFLNTLTYTQQVTRTTNAPSSAAGTGALTSGNADRSAIDIQIPGVAATIPAVYACNLNGNAVYGEAADGMDLGCNWLSWGDLSAYLDWSGLRPMTELEFEKACRGPIAAVANEYVWGTTSVATSAYTLNAAGTSNEGIATNYGTTLGNATYAATVGVIGGPMRVGIFAANGSNSGRVTAGATYYGIMQMGDNLFERPVTIMNIEGRSFTGVHGNGTLNAAGDQDASSWPASGTAMGSGMRGGTWPFPDLWMRVSERNNAGYNVSTRERNFGGRGVRSAP
ncbi:MAG: hypothetical protein IPL77_00330 [Flavobacteriales bacterium]|nr:hypothetical protein [Flavobacteriales bacterium]